MTNNFSIFPLLSFRNFFHVFFEMRILSAIQTRSETGEEKKSKEIPTYSKKKAIQNFTVKTKDSEKVRNGKDNIKSISRF